jgi:hypothetical protein
MSQKYHTLKGIFTNQQENRRAKLIFIKILLTCFVLIPLNSFSQKHHKNEDEDENNAPKNKSWSFSINTGAAFANNYQANFYNGADGNQNTLNYILSNKYWHNEIRQAIGDSFALYGMPTKMKYDPAFCVGFSIKKMFNNHVGMFGQFDFSRLKAADVFTLKIGSTPTSQMVPNLLNCPIWGKEDRIDIDLGVCGSIYLANKINGFLEGGLNINNTRVKENKIQIENLAYSIIDIYANQPYVPNTQLQEYQIKEGGLGIGIFLSPGVEFRFNENVAIDLLGTAYWTRINLMHYDAWKPRFNAMIRFVFSTHVEVVN